jgi:hypothetical protein
VIEYEIDQFPQAEPQAIVEIPRVRIAGTGDRIIDAWDPRLKDIPDYVREIIVQGKTEDDDDPKRRAWSRSEWQWHASCEMVRHGVDSETHFVVLMDPDLGLWPTIQSHGGERYARRQIERATEVARSFATNEEGKIYPTMYSNIRLALIKLGCQFSYDEFRDVEILQGLEGLGPVIDDAVVIRLHRLIQDVHGFLVPKLQLFDAITDLCREGAFHPVRDYLAGLKWDGVARVETWLTEYAGVEDTSYSRAVGRIFLLAAVRRARQPGVRFGKMLILEGGQGKGKSTLLRNLMPDPAWFSDEIPLAAGTRELVEGTRGKWLLEEAELSTFGNAQVEKLKAAITRQTDRARPAYGRKVMDIPRQYVLAGSTNEERYLEDRTGNIRFWPTKTIGRLKFEEIVSVRDQLWAEVAVREAAGESLDLDEGLWDVAGEEQSQRETIDPWEELLEEELPAVGKVLPNDLYIFLGYDTNEKRDKRIALRVGRIMRRLGWKYGPLRFDKVPHKCWVRGEGALVQVTAEIRGEGRERHLITNAVTADNF